MVPDQSEENRQQGRGCCVYRNRLLRSRTLRPGVASKRHYGQVEKPYFVLVQHSSGEDSWCCLGAGQMTQFTSQRVMLHVNDPYWLHCGGSVIRNFYELGNLLPTELADRRESTTSPNAAT